MKQIITTTQNIRDKMQEALNVLDEFACEATRDNDNGEAEEQQEAYDLLSNFIKAYTNSITIPLTENDLQELQGGEEFNWTFDGIDVKLINEDLNEEEESN